jgi:8-oxo-dGTP pyrophosphatase MutT (NUDIX family)
MIEACLASSDELFCRIGQCECDPSTLKSKKIGYQKMGVKAEKKTVRKSKKSPKKVKRAIRLQYGALPYKFTEANGLELLLVTTRETKRWIIPKGWPIKGLKPGKSAAREAYEEAGIRGTVATKSIGIFSYEKRLEENSGTVPCEVRVFPLLVKRQSITWPEAHERETRWFESAKALSAVKDKGLRELIESFVKKITAPEASG